MRRGEAVHRSSGNVFADMGAADAEERLAKAELSRIIRRTIAERGLKQAQAAALLGVRQPDVSDLVRGRLRRFGMERLQRFLTLLGMDVEVRVTPRAKRSGRRGKLKVELLQA
jgi:predicted XRE-type DNA-binding protein